MANEYYKKAASSQGIESNQTLHASIAVRAPFGQNLKVVRLRLAAAIALLGAAIAVQAQEAATPTGELAEVIVTATRRSENVNKVPISVDVVSQQTFDEQGIRSSEDLQKAIPSLSVIGGNSVARGIDSSNVSLANYTIRGIASPGGTPTTGVYMDDVPLMKRNAVSNAQDNGTPTPMLFDLERVEVLRGPQGTLYGGSSEGGAVRFLTRQPSVTETSGSTFAEASNIDHGGNNFEFNGAFGAPLIKDVLGFRVAVFGRQNGGWIDMRDPYGVGGDPVLYKDANSSNAVAVRGALLYQPTDDLKITFMEYHHRFHDDGGDQASNYFQPQNGASTVSTGGTCFHGSMSPVPCTTPGAYVSPSSTYGPYQLGSYDALDNFLMPSTSTLNVSSLTVDYKIGAFSLKSVTSYVRDQTNTLLRLSVWPPAYQDGLGLYAPDPGSPISWNTQNQRGSFAEELRASYSSATVDVVGGLYFSHTVLDTVGHYAIGTNSSLAEANLFTSTLYGIPNANNLFSVPLLPDNSVFNRSEQLDDTESAAFVDATWHVTDRLNLLAGVRYSILQLDSDIDLWGPTQGTLVPTVENGGVLYGQTKDIATTPRAGAQFQFSPDAMIYATAAEGFRGGGVNPGFPAGATCFSLSSLGLAIDDLPKTYKSDSVWSYEVGSKLRFLDRLQLNGSLFYINWKDVQTSASIGGCPAILFNAGKAKSQGFDLQADAAIATGLTASLGVSYVDAEYTAAADGPTPAAGFPAIVLVAKGDKLPVPGWQSTATLRYQFPLVGTLMAFVRGDYIYSSAYYSNPAGPGEAGYAPDDRLAAARHLANLRLGVSQGSWDANLFITNLFESRTRDSVTGGREGCPISEGAACNTPYYYNPVFSVTYPEPRVIGIQFTNKF
jgi:iron complex outermembrane recepter protein